MATREGFVQIFSEFTKGILGEARLFPKLSQPRVIEAHGAWQNDLRRVGGHEPNLGGGLDHFKQSGHLTFWLRRMSPIVEAHDLTSSLGDAPGLPLTSAEKDLREILFGYCNEFVAFELGYQICLFYERAREMGKNQNLTLVPDDEYYKIMCHFLKYKTVSPHAMFLIYKSLFFNRDVGHSSA